MPVVPVAERHTLLDPLPGQKMQAADFSAGSQMAGAGMEQAGQALGELSRTKQDIAATVDEASAKDLYNQYVQHSDDVLHSGNGAFYTLSGKAALDARPATEQALQDKRKELIGAAQNQRQRVLLGRALDPRVEEDIKGVGFHATEQGIKYNADESESRVSLLGADAARNYLDPTIAEQSIATARGEIEHLGQINGWGPEETQAKQLKWTSATRRDIATRFVYEGAQGPDIARHYADLHKGDLTADDAQAIEDHARTQQGSIEAEQRRQEAEARRQAAEDARAAGERAADVARQISAGVPQPATVVADAIGDARAAHRPALEAEIRTGAFKNNLTVQWRDATPAELTDRLNILGPKISKAGGHPDPNDIIEMEHLTTLRDKSRSQLGSDPISWGAQHLGMQIPPVNWSDPSSIQARVQYAQQISARTGAPIRPLTADEAASLAPVAATGSIEQRRGLLAQLAAMGPAATSAAEQIAPNDHVFQSLVGLATSSNRSVAAGYVGQALAGAEVLKRNGATVDHPQAQIRFNNYAGGAFRLMPYAADGVFTNAKNIVAAWADQHGHTDWKHDSAIGDQFEGAVDAALGSYRQNGVKYGGLGTWKGERIVLPDGMSQQQLEERITRADQTHLLRGSNGVPVWASGHPLTVGEVKSQHLVAVGNGVYRLTDGSNYVAKKGGGFYELNVNAIR